MNKIAIKKYKESNLEEQNSKDRDSNFRVMLSSFGKA